MKHACLNGNTVVAIVNTLTEQEIIDLLKTYTSVLLIEDLIVQPEINWRFVNGEFLPPVGSPLDIPKLIKSRIEYYQKVAPALVTELYVANTLAGITVQQSDQMFEEFQDVLTRLREGAFPTALYRLNQKEPSGFVTQTLIDTWKNLIQEKINS
jgi:hypothetical protein